MTGVVSDMLDFRGRVGGMSSGSSEGPLLAERLATGELGALDVALGGDGLPLPVPRPRLRLGGDASPATEMGERACGRRTL